MPNSEFFEEETNDENNEQGTESDTNSRKEILCAILRSLMLVDQMNGSQRDILKAIDFAKGLYCHKDSNLSKLWPKNWKELEKLLKENGYEDPKELYVCLDDSHYSNWDVLDSPHATCRFCEKEGAIKYYYLGLPSKVKMWFSDPAMCSKMLGHWRDKEHWITGEGANFTLKEVWDGARFNNLSWFWDPEKQWLLPCKCNFCDNILSTDEISNAPADENGVFSLTCEECGTHQQHHLKYARGDPRNIALIGHWDGWTPFGLPGKHSSGK